MGAVGLLYMPFTGLRKFVSILTLLRLFSFKKSEINMIFFPSTVFGSVKNVVHCFSFSSDKGNFSFSFL